ncbi:MAG: SGNH/GDSL hydrolase family protein [Microgenomates group bacterium]
MQKARGKIFIVCIFAECLSIAILCVYIIALHKTQAMRAFHVLPLSQNTVQFPIDTALRYYYELAPNTTKIDDFAYMRLTGKAVHTINADGLNERMMYALSKPITTYRIVTVGDSFTEGAFVDTKNNYSEVLEDMLNSSVQCPSYQHFEVINLGVAGYDMQYNLERFKQKGLKYDPNLVILWTDENDYVANNEKYYALVDTWDPVKESPEIIALYQSQGDFAPESNAVWYKFNSLYTRTTLVAEELTYLRNFMQFVQSPLIIFSLSRTPKDIRQSIQTMAYQQQGAFYFPEIPDVYDKFPDDHPSVVGHTQFAEFLYRKLQSSVLTDCVFR